MDKTAWRVKVPSESIFLYSSFVIS